VFDFVFQAFTTRNHADLVKRLLQLNGIRHAILSVAFVNSGGIALIEEALRPARARVDAYVGIRNDITSAQGLKALLPIVHRLFIVDTGSRYRIFHPKVFMSRSQTAAHLLVGSANLTTGGLWNNIEASLALEINLADAADRTAIENLEAQFEGLSRTYPLHVVAITTNAQINALLSAGRVIDETVAEPPRPRVRGGNPSEDKTPRIELPLAVRRSVVQRPARAERNPRQGRARGRPSTGNLSGGYDLVWESKGLTERDLNIPTGANTAPTGSMLFKKGQIDEIDQRHYFRDEVFSELDWSRDPRPTRRHWERARATFRLVIKNIEYGEFELDLSHNSDRKSASYAQHNSMTQVHWGPIAGHIRHRDLLRRTLYLYRNRRNPHRFIIEID
jgi:HKD family nuclease